VCEIWYRYIYLSTQTDRNKMEAILTLIIPTFAFLSAITNISKKAEKGQILSIEKDHLSVKG
jgi:hypothetical protein